MLEQYFENVTFSNIIYCRRKFSKFYNLIIHYTGTKKSDFYKFISKLFRKYIIDNYEENILKDQLKLDFFYFSKMEQAEIITNLKNSLIKAQTLNEKTNILENSIQLYITQNKSCLIDGFINFRINSYKKYLQDCLENEVHTYVVSKEYIEYINVLHEYICESTPKTEQVHLIYSHSEKTLLDKDKNIITTTNGKKYISDISFSENDFILNSILSLLPKKIFIHTNLTSDKFIKFLSSIFADNCVICSGCNICSNSLKKNNQQTHIPIN